MRRPLHATALESTVGSRFVLDERAHNPTPDLAGDSSVAVSAFTQSTGSAPSEAAAVRDNATERRPARRGRLTLTERSSNHIGPREVGLHDGIDRPRELVPSIRFQVRAKHR